MEDELVIINYSGIEVIHNHVRFTLDISNPDEAWRIVGEILWGVADHDMTAGIKRVAERYREVLVGRKRIRIQGYTKEITLDK